MKNEIPSSQASPFYRELSEKVNAYFSSKGISERGNLAMKIKTFFLVFLYLFSYLLLYRVPATGFSVMMVYLFMGLTSSLVMVNISHDAAHGAIFQSRFLNRLMSYTFNLVGSNEYVWRLTHNLVHHDYPNVPDTDPDLDQGPLVRLSSALPRYGFHRYQHYYAVFVYSLFSLYLVFIKDFRLLFGKEKIGHIQYRSHPVKEIFILIATKIFFLGYILVLPALLLPVSWLALLGGYIIYSMVQGLIIAFLTAPVHVTSETSFAFRYEEGSKGGESWVERQVETTTDFIVNNRLLDFFLGGANYQVIHHLFPGISHIHFRELNPILKQCTEKYHVRYLREPFIKACSSHFRKLKYFGRYDS